MNGGLCATITATAGREGGRSEVHGQHPARTTGEDAEKLLRNARIRAKDKESESHSKELYPLSEEISQSHQKDASAGVPLLG